MMCPNTWKKEDPHKRGSILTLPCGKCGACLYNRRADWSYRLAVQYHHSDNGKFLTLTYSDEYLPIYNGYPILDKYHLTTFHKRLRKFQDGNKASKYKYYSVGEYGTKHGRPHYHVMAFNIWPKTQNALEDLWPLGEVHIGDVNGSSIHYMTKYHVNPNKSQHRIEPEFATMSNGLGMQYIQLNTRMHNETGQMYVMNNGYKQRMPRVYKDRLFDELTRKELSDQQQEEQIERILQEYDRLAKLGYDDPELAFKQRIRSASDNVFHKSKQRGTF